MWQGPNTDMKVLLSGCSLSDFSGWGEPGNKSDERCWYNLVTKENQFDLTNVSFGGKSNREILHSAAEVMFCFKDKFDLIIIQLTSTNRNWFFNSDDWHNFSIINGSSITNYYNDNEYLALKLFKVRFANRLREVERDLTSLVSLHKIAEACGTKLLILNFMDFVQACQIYVDDLIPDAICGDLTDSVIFKIEKLFKSLDWSYKLGFEKSLISEQIDFADDDSHPGEKSNKMYADLVNSALKNMEILV